MFIYLVFAASMCVLTYKSGHEFSRRTGRSELLRRGRRRMRGLHCPQSRRRPRERSVGMSMRVVQSVAGGSGELGSGSLCRSIAQDPVYTADGRCCRVCANSCNTTDTTSLQLIYTLTKYYPSLVWQLENNKLMSLHLPKLYKTIECLLCICLPGSNL